MLQVKTLAWFDRSFKNFQLELVVLILIKMYCTQDYMNIKCEQNSITALFFFLLSDAFQFKYLFNPYHSLSSFTF